MTAPVTGFSINIAEDGTATFQAADWSVEGQAWAIPARQIPLSRVRRIAEILGPDAADGFEARVVATRQRLEDRIATEQAALDRIAKSRDALRLLNEAAIEP